MEMIEVTWGEKLEVFTNRFLRPRLLTFKQVVLALGAFEPGVQNTWSKLFDLPEAPVRAADARRAYLLLLLMGENPRRWGILLDRPALWPPDRELRRMVGASLASVAG